jgi:hypothetical protein
MNVDEEKKLLADADRLTSWKWTMTGEALVLYAVRHSVFSYPFALAVIEAAQRHHGRQHEDVAECALCLAVDAWNEADPDS